MPKVILTANLKKYFPVAQAEIDGKTLKDVLDNMERMRPLFKSYILEENNHIRKHVNVFIDQQLVRDKTNVNIEVGPASTIHLMQALSGG